MNGIKWRNNEGKSEMKKREMGQGTGTVFTCLVGWKNWKPMGFSKLLFLLLVVWCLHVSVECGCPHAHMWRPEEDIGRIPLSFYNLLPWRQGLSLSQKLEVCSSQLCWPATSQNLPIYSHAQFPPASWWFRLRPSCLESKHSHLVISSASDSFFLKATL